MASVATGGTGIGTVSVTNNEASVTFQATGGVSHGLNVYSNYATLSGGTNSTTLTLDNAGAHLDNQLEMGGNRVTNMADGIAPMDAVNKRQLDDVAQRAYSGIASVAAMAAIPEPQGDHRYSIGVGGGYYQKSGAAAIGINARVSPNLAFKLAGAYGTGDYFTGGAGFGYSF